MSEKTPTHAFNPTAPATSALRDAFLAVRARIAAPTPADIQYLRGRVTMLVRALKQQGTLPERVIIIVQQIAAESGLVIVGHPVLEDVVKQCVDEYYPEGSQP
jgi:hypothetical protein